MPNRLYDMLIAQRTRPMRGQTGGLFGCLACRKRRRRGEGGQVMRSSRCLGDAVDGLRAEWAVGAWSRPPGVACAPVSGARDRRAALATNEAESWAEMRQYWSTPVMIAPGTTPQCQ